jgi:hypothetical protein
MYFGEPNSEGVFQITPGPPAGYCNLNYYCKCIVEDGLGLCRGDMDEIPGSGPPYVATPESGCTWINGSAKVNQVTYADDCQTVNHIKGC